MFRNTVTFYGEEMLEPRPTPNLEDHPLSAVCDIFIDIFAAILHIRRPFLHPQPEDAPCCGDRDPHIMEYQKRLSIDKIYLFNYRYLKPYIT